jgi:hypothetical protein
MALIIRIDVDRPYGRTPVTRHVLSRLSSDYFFPKIKALGYLRELKEILLILNERRAPAYVFFRRCTLPSPEIMALLDAGRHEIGLHLENSRSFAHFEEERGVLERHIGRKINAFSKHGSGTGQYGRRHYAPYESEIYLEWARLAQMKVFLGNLEDPRLRPVKINGCFIAYPSAFWLEPPWRDTNTFTIPWLQAQAKQRDIVLLLHPENVLASPELTEQLKTLTSGLETKLLM